MTKDDFQAGAGIHNKTSNKEDTTAKSVVVAMRPPVPAAPQPRGPRPPMPKPPFGMQMATSIKILPQLVRSLPPPVSAQNESAQDEE